MFIAFVALSRIGYYTQGRDSKKAVLEEFKYPNIENREKITGKLAKELTFSPSNKEKSPINHSISESTNLPEEFDECDSIEKIYTYSTGYRKLEFSTTKKSICIKTYFGLLIEKKGMEVYQYYKDYYDDNKNYLNHYKNILAIHGSDYNYYYKITYPDISGPTTVNLYFLPKSNYYNYYYYIICNNFDGSIYSMFPSIMDEYPLRLSDYVVIPGSAGTNVKITKDNSYENTEIYEFSGDDSKLSDIQSASGYTHKSEEATSAFGDLQDNTDRDETV